jgi:hypothetical protein
MNETTMKDVGLFIEKYGYSTFWQIAKTLPKKVQNDFLSAAPSIESAFGFAKRFSYKMLFLNNETNGAPIFDSAGKQEYVLQRLADGALLQKNGNWLTKEEFEAFPDQQLQKEFPQLLKIKMEKK